MNSQHATYTSDEIELIRRSIPIVRKAARLAHKRIGAFDVDDYVSIGLGTLLNVVIKYDPDRGSFDNYLNKRLRWAMKSASRAFFRTFDPRRGFPDGVARRYFDHHSRPVTVSSASEEIILPSVLEFRGTGRVGREVCSGNMSVGAVHPDADPESLVRRFHISNALHEVMDLLPVVERTIISLHYFSGEQFTTIANLLNLSRPRVAQLHQKALERCAKLLIQRGISSPGI